MAHTDRDPPSQPQGIIQQKPPPPPGYKAPGGDGDTVDPAAPTDPQEPAPSAPQEAPQQQPIAPRVASAPASSRRTHRKPSGHIVLSPPPQEIDPLIIGRRGDHGRPEMRSDPMTLIDYPRGHHTARTSSPTAAELPQR